MDISSVGDLKQQITSTDSSKVQSADVVNISEERASELSNQVEQKATDKEQVDLTVKKMNDFVQNIERNLSFSVDEETGHDVVKVVDTSTDELIRQFPTEEFLKMSKNLNDVAGLLFKDSV